LVAPLRLFLPQKGAPSNSKGTSNLALLLSAFDYPKLPPTKRSPFDVLPARKEERVLTTGLLSKEANFRLIVSGPIGVKEIERLIKKLELDKEILADPDAENEEAAN
jgi:hypothetical protein